jgi:V8-like Glu-specific endopeptidase
MEPDIQQVRWQIAFPNDARSHVCTPRLWYWAALAATGLAMLLASGSHVQAQLLSGETIQSSQPSANANPVPPSGPYHSKLPLATPDQFYNADKLAPKSVPTGTPGVSSGKAKPVPPAFGTSTAPYTTARVAVTVLGDSSTVANTPVTSFPYRATGKLYLKDPEGIAECTAALIKKGVLLTAAHCVANFGKQQFYNSFVWCPANTSSAGGVYDCFNAGPPRVLTTYLNGTDICTQSGVICNDDLATLLVPPRRGVFAGDIVDWYSYSWNCYSCTRASVLGNVTTVQITELGYPGALDSGFQMERTDAVGWYFASGGLKNTQMGSAQTEGASGGPWLANFGTVPSVAGGASLGSDTTQSIVGVTSYLSATIGFNRLGSSFFGQNIQHNGDFGGFGAGNIGLLVHDTCIANPSFC